MINMSVRNIEKYRGLISTIAFVVIALIVVGIFSGLIIGEVGVSEAAVIIDPVMGGKSVVYGPKIFFKKPWEYYVTIYYGVESLDMWTDEPSGMTGEWPAITCLTRDGLGVAVDITVRWRVNPDKVLELYEMYPLMDWETKTLVPLLRERVRDIISRYTAIETIEKRSEISATIVNEFTEAVMKESNLAQAIIIEGIDLRNIELPKSFKAAVEEKLAEEQQKIAAKFRAERMQIEANATAMAKILEARGEALAQIEKAKGEAEAILIKMNSTARSYQLILDVIGGNRTSLAQLLLLREIVKESQGPVIIILSPSGEGAIPVIPFTFSSQEEG